MQSPAAGQRTSGCQRRWRALGSPARTGGASAYRGPRRGLDRQGDMRGCGGLWAPVKRSTKNWRRRHSSREAMKRRIEIGIGKGGRGSLDGLLLGIDVGSGFSKAVVCGRRLLSSAVLPSGGITGARRKRSRTRPLKGRHLDRRSRVPWHWATELPWSILQTERPRNLLSCGGVRHFFPR